MSEPGVVSDAVLAWARETLGDSDVTRCDCNRAGSRWAGQHLCSTGGGIGLCFYVDEITNVCVVLAVYETSPSTLED